MNVTAAAVPPRMKGIRFPIGVETLSESVPRRGKRNKARTLSSAMITPLAISGTWKLSSKISGTVKSYICQKADMDMKARPIRNVRL